MASGPVAGPHFEAGPEVDPEVDPLKSRLTWTKTAAKAWFILAFAAAIIAPGPWPSAPAALAAGGIEVVRSDWEVRYPHELSFALTLESELDIADVRLFYRPLGSNVWSYSYADFSPGPPLPARQGKLWTARLSFRLTGSDYVPSGAQVEYYYRITDVAGNVYRTATDVLEVLDQRFRWDRTGIGSLLLLHHDLSSSRTRAGAEDIEASLALARDLLALESVRPIRGVVYNSSAEARDALPHQSRTITDAGVFGGYAFAPWSTFVVVGFNAGLIAHESAHLLLDQALGERALPVPAWFDEGFSIYVEPGLDRRRGSVDPGGLPLSAMTAISGTPSRIRAFYRKSGSVVAYLIDEYGADSFRRLIRELALGHPFEEGLVNTYGFDVGQLEARWAGDTGGPAAESPPLPNQKGAGGNLWASSSAIVLGVLAVAVSFYVTVRYALGKLRRAQDSPDSEEGLQPWEDPDLLDDDGEIPR